MATNKKLSIYCLRDIFVWNADKDLLKKCLSEASSDWTADIIQMAKKPESSKATARHMETAIGQPSGQPQAHVNQLRHQRVNLPPKRQGKKRKKPHH